MASYRISPRQQKDDPEDQNTNDRPDYTRQKENYRNDIIKFERDLQYLETLKKQWINEWLVTEETINNYAEYYIIINTHGRIPNFFIKAFKGLYRSAEFKYFANFNRQVIINIKLWDLKSFIVDMNEIANYNTTWPDFIPKAEFKSFKLIKDFHYYSIDERVDISTPSEESFLLQFFQIAPSKRDGIIKQLKNDWNTLIELTPSIYKIETVGNIETLTRYAWIYSDIQKIEPAFVEVIIEPSWQTKEVSQFSIDDTSSQDGLIKVGVIDSGVGENRTILEPFIEKTASHSYVDNSPLIDSQDHWTGVAGIVVFWNQVNEGQTILKPYAKVLSLKILSASSSFFSPDLFINIIEEFYVKKNIKVFNMSVNLIKHKNDNENHDLITYILDYCLAKYPDILFFVSAWNVNNIWELKKRYNASNNYKFDEWTNICTPADSTNALSVGSISTDKKVSEFSRKNCLDYWTPLTLKKTNGTTKITTDIWYRSPYFLKPDFVEFWENIRLLSSQYTDEVTFLSGTSFSSPFVCHIATRILNQYPSLSANTVKALLLNTSQSLQIQLDIDATNWVDLPETVKDRNILYRWNTNGSHTKIQDREIEFLNQRYVWFGQINLNRALYSDEKRATILIQDKIKLNHENIYEINLPDDLQNNILKWTGNIRIIGSLSYNHIPILSDHLNYNPIHMAYRILACSEQELQNITNEIKRLDNELNNYAEGSADFERIVNEKEEYEKQIKQYVVKVWGTWWSHDNYYWNQYANNQTKWNSQWIRKTSLQQKLNNKLFVEIRCNLKTIDTTTNIFQEIRDFIFNTKGKIVQSIEDINRYMDQAFWFCLTIENQNTDWIDLHSTILNANLWILSEANVINEADVNTEQTIDLEV